MSALVERAKEARQAIHDNDLDRLRQLIEDHPQLLHWRDGEQGEVLLQATTSYANFPGAENEDHWNRRQCAALLIDAGALVDPRVVLRILGTGAHKMMALFEKKGVWPHNLRTLTGLGKLKRVRACFDGDRLLDSARPDPALRNAYPDAEQDWPSPDREELVVADALLYACRLGHEKIADFLLERCTRLDPDLDARIEDREAFLEQMMLASPEGARFGYREGSLEHGPSIVWQAHVTQRLHQAMEQADLDALRAILAAEGFVLGEAFLATQEKLLSVAAYSPDALPFIEAVLDSGAAIANANTPPASQAISYAIEYGHLDYLPVLNRIWPIPDDLPHAAGRGDLPAVQRWFDEQGRPQLGDLDRHHVFPEHFPEIQEQDVLDRALAWAVVNEQFETADWLLEHGADINTRWGTHEPASILHEMAYAGRTEAVRYLLSKGIDRTIKDTRFESDAAGWAAFAGHEELAELIRGYAS